MVLNIYPLGINYSTKELLFEPIKEKNFGEALCGGLMNFGTDLIGLTNAISKGVNFRGEMIRKIEDPADPIQAGWTFLINKNEPRSKKIIEKIRPLAEHRGMVKKDEDLEPLLFYGSTEDDWVNWIENEYQALDLEDEKKAPEYILIVGDPLQVPFHFQSMLDVTASVGRIDFDSDDDLEEYVKKIIKLENGPSPVVEQKATFFATNHGKTNKGLDPTFFSHQYMVEPLADRVSNKLGFQIEKITEKLATKKKLYESLKESRSALVYTASHGMGAPDGNTDEQKRVTGAIVCQDWSSKDDEGLLMAEDIPKDKPFLKGAVFFQFACFGYGTPKESDLSHWMINPDGTCQAPQKIAATDFVSCIPKRLLANPDGPIAFIGHVDMALLHGFADPNFPYPVTDRWSTRIQPFLNSVDELLSIMPIGLAMNAMNTRYNIENARITLMYNKLKNMTTVGSGIPKDLSRIMKNFPEKLSEAFLKRTDAQNYMVFGDPAAHLRIAVP